MGGGSKYSELGYIFVFLFLFTGPRLLLSRCKKFSIPIEKIYNKTQREKFAWAIDMAEKDFEF